MTTVHTREALSQSLEAVGSVKARTKVIRYRPAKSSAPARARMRLSFFNMGASWDFVRFMSFSATKITHLEKEV